MHKKGTNETECADSQAGLHLCYWHGTVRFSWDEAHLSELAKLNTCIISNTKYNENK